MAQIINMPKEGITVESCLVGAWRKEVGDPVAVDDVLFDYETDKAAFECLSQAEGVLLHKFYAEGDEVPVLMPVAIIGESGEDISGLIAEGSSQADTDPAPAPVEEAQDDGADNETTEDEEPETTVYEDEPEGEDDAGPVKASPRARSFAEEQGVDLAAVIPTGPEGRILEADVIAASNEPRYDDVESVEHQSDEAACDDEKTVSEEESEAVSEETLDEQTVCPEDEPETDGQEAAPGYVDEQFSKIRTVIAKTMVASLQMGAQLTNHHSFDATSILEMREDFKTSPESAYSGVSVGDIILFVTSRVLAKHPEINALVAEKGIRKYYTVNLGFAVDTPRGLMVPTIFGAERKSLREISGEVKALAAAAIEGRISPDQLSGGTFTVSNLGATGVEVFTPIINPPQAAIAGISGIVERVRKEKDGSVIVYPSIGVSLTYDHRAIDGAPASRFAKELCEALAAFSWKTIALEIDNE